MATANSVIRVLFVDDDPLILQGLQRMLRPMRNEWAMSFAESGTKALEMMAEEPFQVVVSDMRMPGMNGAQLLTETKNRYAKTVRLILSGHADKDLIFQSVGTAHQFLSKPCEPEAIRAAISRASTFNSSIRSDQIQKLIVQMDKIPSIPAVLSRSWWRDSHRERARTLDAGPSALMPVVLRLQRLRSAPARRAPGGGSAG